MGQSKQGAISDIMITLFLMSRVIFPTDFVIYRIVVYGTTFSCFTLFNFQPFWNTCESLNDTRLFLLQTRCFLTRLWLFLL